MLNSVHRQADRVPVRSAAGQVDDVAGVGPPRRRAGAERDRRGHSTGCIGAKVDADLVQCPDHLRVGSEESDNQHAEQGDGHGQSDDQGGHRGVLLT